MSHDQPAHRHDSHVKKSPSRLPALASLGLLSVAFACSLWHHVFFNFSLSSHLISYPKSGLSSGLSLIYDGLMIVGWTLPLFLAVLMTLIFTPPSGALNPAFCASSPDQTLRLVRTAIVVGNVACLGLSLVATQVIGNPYAWPHEKYPGVPAWVEVLAMLVGRAGMPAFWNMGWSLVTAMRYPALAPLQSALGLAYEHSVAIHRTLGWMTTFWLAVHGFGYMFVYFMQGIVWDAMQPGSHGSWFNFFALIGLICLLLLAITSHFRIRRPAYSIFAMFHWLWVPFMVVSILHITSYFMVLVPPLFLYIVDRLACLFGTHSGPLGGSIVTATAVRVSDESVAILIPIGPMRCNIIDQNNLDSQLAQMYTPGRFMCLAFATDMPGVFPSHPFSIAAFSIPNRTAVIMIRALGPWSKRVHALATAEGAAIRLRVSGPFSVSAVAHGASRGQVMVAGGIGISKYLGAGNRGVLPTDDKAASTRSSSNSSGRGSTKASTPPPRVSTASDPACAESESITPHRSSGDGVVDESSKFWLCKDTAELHYYLAFGADLAGWQAHSSKGFKDEPTSSLLPSYPLFDQLYSTPPLSHATYIALYLLHVAIYTATYLVARTVLAAPDYPRCAKTPTIQLWLWCQGRTHALVPFLTVLIGFPIVVQLVAVTLVTLRASVRPASRFHVHDVSQGLKGVNQVERRVDFGQDVGNVAGRGAVVVRTCTSKPVRAVIRGQLWDQSGKRTVSLSHVDDGIGF